MKKCFALCLIIILLAFSGCDNSAGTENLEIIQNDSTVSSNNSSVVSATDDFVQYRPAPYPVTTKSAYLYNSLDEFINSFELNGFNELCVVTEDTVANIPYSGTKGISRESVKKVDCLVQNGLYKIMYDGKEAAPVNDLNDSAYALYLCYGNDFMLSRYRFKIETEHGECELYLTVYSNHEKDLDSLDELVENYRTDMSHSFDSHYIYTGYELNQSYADIEIAGKKVRCITNVVYNEENDNFELIKDSPYYMFVSPFSDNVLFHISFISSLRFYRYEERGDILPHNFYILAAPQLVYSGFDWLSKFDFEKVDIGWDYQAIYDSYDHQKWLNQQYQ